MSKLVQAGEKLFGKIIPENVVVVMDSTRTDEEILTLNALLCVVSTTMIKPICTCKKSVFELTLWAEDGESTDHQSNFTFAGHVRFSCKSCNNHPVLKVIPDFSQAGSIESFTVQIKEQLEKKIKEQFSLAP